MKSKTSELTGPTLDWAVAEIEYPEWKAQGYLEVFPYDLYFDDGTTYAPSGSWSLAGPIIEREMITVGPAKHAGYMAWAWPKGNGFYGDTPLIAAMRCYVASKLGDEVEIPEELK